MDQLLKFVNNLNSGQRAVIVGGFSILFVFLIGLLVYSNIKAEDEKLGYTIGTNLTKNQVMMASSELEASGIPFSITGSGNAMSLKTSKEFVNIAKVKLVTSEASTSQHTGWEIFEKSSLGSTNFENKVKYMRALEGELSRSLEGLNGVLKADVKIGIPKETVFTETKSDTTASAVLTLRPGVYLTQKQIDGIRNFVASAIPELKSENIKLIDQEGTLLEKSADDLQSTKLSTQEKYKQNLEQKYQEKIVALLEPFVGAGRVVARVNADLEFKRTESREEIFQPEGTIRSQQTEETTANTEDAKAGAQDVPGAQANIQAGQNGANNNVQAKSSKEDAKTTTNFEISNKVINQKDEAFASVKKITAAVTFDSAVLDKVADKQAFVDSLNKIVQDTVGFDTARGDQVSVKDFKFIASKDGAADANETGSGDTAGKVKTIMQEFGEYGQYLLAAILLFVFYKKFIASNEISLMTQGGAPAPSRQPQRNPQSGGSAFEPEDFENEFDNRTAAARLKAKVRSQISNNIEGMDEEEAAKYEVLIEELDKTVNNSPQEIAQLIELLLSEGDTKLRGKRKS